ncbi:MAG: hypothetical protein M3516_09275 [Actinomycetota bacterium]|nr:hypothetical protein [Actinomycetota bacterium]
MLGRTRHRRASPDAPDDRRRVLFRAAALIPGYIVYRLQGDDRLTRGLLMGAGVV